ncbi:phage tail protein I, partial [Dissulfurispira sp.]|uniref:phage tail protein I n=1 Tax=Dissulfurispira sp. TaxID=2817609 RepID=UPI002FDAC201
MANKTKDLLPPNLQGDKNIEGLCAAADKVFSVENELDKLLVYLIDDVPASILPYLAWQFHVEGYDLTKTDTEKRSLIKKSLELHRYKGTPWAVENAISTLGFPSEVIEWFRYGGNSYRFKVSVDISKNRGIDEQLISQIEKLIHQYKNVRSWLETIILYVPTKGSAPKYSCAAMTGESISIYPYQQT